MTIGDSVFKETIIMPKATAVSYNSVRVSWSAAGCAGGYEVWRSTVAASGYKLAATVIGTSSTSTGLATGTTYYYKIRAYRKVNGVRVYGSYSAVVSAKPMLSAATGLKAARVSATSIRLTWYVVAGVMKYEVSRAASASGTYTKLTEVTAAAYTGTGLTTGKRTITRCGPTGWWLVRRCTEGTARSFPRSRKYAPFISRGCVATKSPRSLSL